MVFAKMLGITSEGCNSVWFEHPQQSQHFKSNAEDEGVFLPK
jgi:hypothetical protein